MQDSHDQLFSVTKFYEHFEFSLRKRFTIVATDLASNSKNIIQELEALQ